MPEENKAPTTVKELGIELQGFKELVGLKFDTMSGEITRLVKALEDASESKADKATVAALEVRVQGLEKAVSKKPWTAIFLSGALMTVLTSTIIYVVNDILRGGN